jgi:hypothetical protein
MATERTIKIQDGKGFQVINASEFNADEHKPILDVGEIIVKPLNVEGAKPFIIDEKDFDERAYEKVRATNANVAEVAKQVDRQTLTEKVEEAEKLDTLAAIDKADLTTAGKASAETPDKTTGRGSIQTPQKQLKANQKEKR